MLRKNAKTARSSRLGKDKTKKRKNSPKFEARQVRSRRSLHP